MRWFYVLIFFVSGFIFGCTSSTKNNTTPPQPQAPPFQTGVSAVELETKSNELNALLKQDSSDRMRWWVTYNLARLWQEIKPEVACLHYKTLSEEALFPLQDVALVRAHQVCTLDGPFLRPLDPLTEKNKPWMKDLLTEASLQVARKTQDVEKEMEIYVQKSKTSLNRREKIVLMQKAITLAEQTENIEKIKEYTDRLVFLSPRMKPKTTKLDRLKIAYDLRKARKFIDSRNVYRRIIKDKKSSEDDKYKALSGIRKSYKLEHKTEDYIDATKDLAQYSYRLFQKYKKKNRWQERYARLYHDTMLTYVRTLWTDGKVTEASHLLGGLPADLENLVASDKVYWLRGRIEEEARNFAQAFRWFDMALVECSEKCGYRIKLLWYKAWTLHKMDRHKESAEVFEKLIAEADENERPKYLFWLARQYSAIGEAELASEKLKKLIEDDPVGYYGILAHRELSLPFYPPQTNRAITSELVGKANSGAIVSYLSSSEGQKASWLIAVGETDLAENYLDYEAWNLRDQKVFELSVWEDIFDLYSRAGAYISMFENLGQLPPDTRKQLLDQKPQIIFPQPYNEIVSEAADKYGVIPELIYSIMRQESAFNHRARSPADAFGLMQLIPSVAKRAATAIKLDYQNHEDLYRPETNIALGSAYLKQLWDRYGGQFVVLAASYNASEKAIRGWIKHRYDGDPVQFIEDIPYEETQGYIKLVLRNLVFYQRLNSGGAAIPFPEWCLENIQDVNI